MVLANVVSAVKGTGLTRGAADVVVELLLTSLLRVSVMWKNCQEERSSKKVLIVRMGPLLAQSDPIPIVRARRLGYSKHAAEMRGLGSQGPSST